ncbi:glycosyltransferase family 2 protein [Candidatus Saccharibacteria bacterium]|nr:glycosyltransferase family 2 protein [Candidatus Saccharibacteria bacterium]
MTTSQNKKVSVVVPNYNYARYINKRIDSIVRQTYPIYELIVLDDCSTDGSVGVIKKKLAEVEMKYPELKIQFVQNEKNSGKAMAQWKKGFDLASGDYVWIAEADDLCSKRFLEEVMKGFNDPEVMLSYTESAIINSWGLMMAPNFRWSRDKEKTGHYDSSYIKDGKTEVEEIMAVRCTIPNISAVVLRKRKELLKYLNEALKFTQVGDWYFYVQVLSDGKISYNRKSLNRFRVHSDSKTGKAKKDQQHYEEILAMHKMFIKEYNLNELVMKRMLDEEKRIAERMGI